MSKKSLLPLLCAGMLGVAEAAVVVVATRSGAST